MVHLKRVYDSPADGDGCRILVDRLWPRGVSKARARIDLWLKDISPSDSLRKWFGHDPAKWSEFKRRYFAELKGNKAPVDLILERIHQGTVTLVYGAKDDKHNNAVALKEYLSHR